MNINIIKKKLEDLGYFTYFSHGNIIIGKKVGEIPDIPGGILLDNFGILSIKDNHFILEYGPAQITSEKEFTSEAKAIMFIQKEFPL